LPVDEAKLARAYNRGLKLEKAGDAQGAATAYRQCLAIDPDDHGGVAVRLASLGLGPVPARASPAYVATLFDQHAGVFDDILVEQLGYAVPMMMRMAADAMDLGPFRRMLDIGCGTGLAAVAMDGRVEHVTGFDLAEAMLAEADERGLYDELFIADAADFLDGWDEEPFDLVIAADVLPYLGELAPLIDGITSATPQGGVVMLSSETLAEEAFGPEGYAVGPHQRFHHAQGHVAGLLEARGFSLLLIEAITVRSDEGVPQPGHLFIARKA
jgi:predicted TPR repeat methyltransferase